MPERNSTANNGSGKLFYAVILAERECDLGSIGLNGQRVHSLHHRDIGALISDYPRVHSIKLLRKNLAPYHRVNWEAAQRYATIPARFGQIARDVGEVRLTLQENYPTIRRELGRLDGMVEMGLKVWWTVDDLFGYLLDTDKTLKAQRDRLVSRATGCNRMSQIQFGQQMYDRMQRARASITNHVLAALPDGKARLDSVRDDRTITNAALLVRKDRLSQLEGAVEGLGSRMGQEYALKLDGPWPPFSFVDHLELHLARV